MGRVYKALDLELDKPVALKTIRAEAGQGPAMLERFKQELVLARKITHKNVIRIYDLGEAEGMKFFTMELVEGESLRDRIRRTKKVPIDECLSLMTQIFEGLAEAHRQDVVHRDLKPQNIMVGTDGVVKIMDFGIARAGDSATMTNTGEMMGTPDYISPEQVKGETADGKSDLYACGVILFEMLTGLTPFKGDTAISKIVARVQVPPPSPREHNSDVPAYLERIVLKCLEVDPDLRYQNAEEILEDIKREQVDRSLPLRIKKAAHRNRVLIAAALLAIAAGVGYRHYSSLPPSTVAADVELEDVQSLVVLPFRNMAESDENEWMAEGIPELLITDLSQLRSLRPVRAERVQQILDDIGKSGQQRFDDGSARSVAEIAGAELALYGKYVESGGGLRVEMSLLELATDVATPLRAQGSPSDLFALVDRMTEQVTAAVNLDLERESMRPVTEVSTDSVGAYRAYHEGLSELNAGANQTAIPLLEEAIEADPEFAIAHARLAEAYFRLDDYDRARLAIQRAERHAQGSALPMTERYQINAIAARIDDDPELAVRNYEELVKLHPGEPQVLLSLASSLETLGRTDEAIERYQEVIELSPDFGEATLGLGRMLVVAGRPEEAIPRLDEALASGDFDEDLEALGMIHSILGVAHRTLASYDASIVELQKSLEYRRQAKNDRGVAASCTNLASTYIDLGRFDQARVLLEEALDIARRTSNSTMESFALISLGNLNQAAGAVDAALENYSASLEIEWERNEHTELAVRLNSIGDAYCELGRYADATVYLKQAEVHIETSNDPGSRGINLLTFARIDHAKGGYEEAIEKLLISIPLLRDTGQLAAVATASDILADIYTQQKRDDDAWLAVEQSLQASEQRKAPIGIAQSAVNEAIHLIEIGDLARAEEALTRAETWLEPIDTGYARSLYHLARGMFYQELGKTDRAEQELELALDSAAASGQFLISLHARLELATTRAPRLSSEELETEILRVLAMAGRRRLRPLEARAYLTLAENRIDSDRVEEAIEALEIGMRRASEFGGVRSIEQGERLKALIKSSSKDAGP